MTNWAYYRVSTEDQTVESQAVGVLEYCKHKGIKIDKSVVDDGISGTVLAKDRNLRIILKKAKKGDNVIVAELSRLGRSASDVINTCQLFIKKGVNCYLVKQNMSIDNTPMGKMMIAILSAFAEMERDLISQRTKEGLKRVRASGKVLGRPDGTKQILKINKKQLKEDLFNGKDLFEIAKSFNITFNVLYKYLVENKLVIFEKKDNKHEYIDNMSIKQFCKKHKLNYNTIGQYKYVGFPTMKLYAMYRYNKKYNSNRYQLLPKTTIINKNKREQITIIY